MVKSVVDFLIRPNFETFNWINLAFYTVSLCFGIFIGGVMSTIVIAGAIYSTLHLVFGRLRWALPGPVRLVWFAFCGFFAADMISAVFHPSQIALNEVLENLPFLGFPALYSITFIDRKTLIAWVEIAAAAASVAAALIIVLVIADGVRPELAAGNSSVLALLGGVLYVLNIAAAIRRTNYESLIFLVAALCASYLVITTGTRGIWPILAVIPLLGMFFLRSRKKIMWAVPLLVVLLGSFGAVIATDTSVESRVESAQTDIRNILSGDMTGSIGLRVQIYRAGYELFLEKPILGYGPGNERQEISKKTAEIDGVGVAFSHAHNAALNAALRAGILGLLALAAMVIVPFAVAYKAEKDHVGQAGFFVLTGILVVYLFSGIAGLMLGHDIHDTVYIAAMCFALYLIFGRAEPERQ